MKLFLFILPSCLFIYGAMLGCSIVLVGSFLLYQLALPLLIAGISAGLFSVLFKTKVYAFMKGDLYRQLYIGAGMGLGAGVFLATLTGIGFTVWGYTMGAVGAPGNGVAIFVMTVTFGIFGAIGGAFSCVVATSVMEQGSYANRTSAVFGGLALWVVVICLIVKYNIGPRATLQTELIGLREDKRQLTKIASREANDLGMERYKERRYQEALEKFNQSVALDDNYANAHYNAACVMSLMLTESPCPSFKEQDVIDKLTRAIALDPRKIDKLLTDPDLSIMKKNYGLWRLAGSSLSSQKKNQAVLCAVDWYGPRAPGKNWHASGLRFSPNGDFMLWTRKARSDGSLEDQESKGWYAWSGQTLTLGFTEPYQGVSKETLIITENGILQTSLLPGPFIGQKDGCDESVPL